MANGRDGTILDYFSNRAKDALDKLTNKREDPEIEHVEGQPLKSYHVGKVKGAVTSKGRYI
jgi:hypothetical protein